MRQEIKQFLKEYETPPPKTKKGIEDYLHNHVDRLQLLLYKILVEDNCTPEEMRDILAPLVLFRFYLQESVLSYENLE